MKKYDYDWYSRIKFLKFDINKKLKRERRNEK